MLSRALSSLSKPVYSISVSVLLLVFACELALSVRQLSQSFDESAHLYAGYQYWRKGDFGANPEHPPLAKLTAAIPILPLKLAEPKVPPAVYFRVTAFIGGAQLLYQNGADRLLWRGRLAASVFSLGLALLMFAAAYEMFGRGAALIALLLCVFEPNLLANGALVTTDMAITCFLFASVYAFYRYVKRPGWLRLALFAVAVSLALAAKHSGLLVFPILIVCGAAELLLHRQTPGLEASRGNVTGRSAARLAGALAAAFVVSFIVLWAFYDFRYQARPAGFQMIPPFAGFAQSLTSPAERSLVLALSRWHILPESYLYGLTDVLDLSSRGRSNFLLGKVYPTGNWFYFPIAFLIKSTLAFLCLLLLVPFTKALRRMEVRREVLFLGIPVLIFTGFSMTSHLNIGLRHLLPIYPFLIVLAAGAAWHWAAYSRAAAAVISVLLVLHAVSSLRAFPDYLTYSNEFAGGPRNTYRLLADANVDWAQSLKEVSAYLRSRHVNDCWFAYNHFAVNPAYYQIPCKALPGAFSGFMNAVTPVPPQISGTVLVSASEASGFAWGPGEMNPYHQFMDRRPDDLIGNAILVFHGTFDVHDIAGVSHSKAAQGLLMQNKLDDALTEAKVSIAMEPNWAESHLALGSVLLKQGRKPEARKELSTALSIARSVHPEFRADEIPYIEEQLKQCRE